LYAAGAAEQHVIAHVRQHEDTTIIVAVPRFACSLMRGEVALPLGAAWKDWSLSLQSGSLPSGSPPSGSLPSELHGRYRNIFTGETLTAEGPLPLAEVFASFPAAVLVSIS
jgi:maltooligosyltrehalose synthase